MAESDAAGYREVIGELVSKQADLDARLRGVCEAADELLAQLRGQHCGPLGAYIDELAGEVFRGKRELQRPSASAWRDASKELPDPHPEPMKMREVLVYVPELATDNVNNNGVCVGYCIVGPGVDFWHVAGSPTERTVTHWQYLPEPPA